MDKDTDSFDKQELEIRSKELKHLKKEVKNLKGEKQWELQEFERRLELIKQDSE